MKQVLDWQGLTRQGAHQGYRRWQARQQTSSQVLEMAREIRQRHPGMGCRDLYWVMADQVRYGRDWCEQLLFDHGFGLKRASPSFTQSRPEAGANLIEGMPIEQANKVWQTDITYYWVNSRWFYLSFVEDVATRQIRASQVADTLEAEPQVQCMSKARASVTSAQSMEGLIVHTDPGAQYVSIVFEEYLQDNDMRHSYSGHAWENAYCERINRTIKRNYLDHRPIHTKEDLVREVKRAVKAYNSEKPHHGLPDHLSPDQFSKALENGKYPDYVEKVWNRLTDPKKLILN